MTQVKWVAVVLFLLGFAHPAFWVGAIIAMEVARGGTDVIAVWLEGKIDGFRE